MPRHERPRSTHEPCRDGLVERPADRGGGSRQGSSTVLLSVGVECDEDLANCHGADESDGW